MKHTLRRNEMEKIGKKTIQPSFFFILLLLLLPCLTTLFWTYHRLLIVQKMSLQVSQLASSVEASKSVRNRKDLFFQSHRSPSASSFLESNEPLCFLETEKKVYDALLEKPYINPTSKLFVRLQQLNDNSDRFKFDLENTEQTSIIKESLLQQQEFVEVDEKDLETLIDLIENPNPLKPKHQTIIKDFMLEKSSSNHSFRLKLQLLQREFLKKDATS